MRDSTVLTAVRDYVNGWFEHEKEFPDTKLTPEQLLDQAGYTLYPECQIEADIQAFRKYYAAGEELCTFKGNRLATNRVWFAVKHNLDQIVRKNFPKPQRQDEYGTSVLSIQFARDKSQRLSIKNRYNHTVDNPDATFGNDLENIIPGLTRAFEQHYGCRDVNAGHVSEISGYALGKDGKFYRANIEADNIYYCENNVLVTCGQVHKFDASKQMLIDACVLDLQKRRTICPRFYGYPLG